jgi:hypothetical protein
MLGAALYNRKIEIQQLYIRQQTNQFTLNGEAALPANASDWLKPDFRGTISASINQLGQFLALFGADPEDFAGKISIQGSMDTHGRNFGGHLTIDGASLTFFKHDIDTFSAKVGLQPGELEVERFDLTRKSDSLYGHGQIDLSPDHNYSGKLNAWTEDVRRYVSRLRESPERKAVPIPLELEATIQSSQWDTHAVVQLPKSSPVTVTANFPLPMAGTWSQFQMFPLEVSIDFPAVFLSTAPRLFDADIFQDGILSGKISLSETLRRPRIVGELQLINGKLATSSNAVSNITAASTRINFDGNRGSLEFLNVATKDVDLALGGEINFEDTQDIKVKIVGATPIFDLMSRPVDCVNRIEIAPAALPLAPAATELELRGAFLQPDWSVSLKEEVFNWFAGASLPDNPSREFPLCFGTGPEEKTLLLGALPRAEPSPQPTPKKREKRR